MKRISFVLALGVCLLFSQACISKNALIVALDAVIAAAQAAVPYLGTDGAIIAPYLNQISTATADATMVLESTDSPTAKAQKIIAEFSAIAIPDLSKTTPAAAKVVTAVCAAAQAFIATVQPATNGVAVAHATAAHPSAFALTTGDRVHLRSIRSKAVSLHTKVL